MQNNVKTQTQTNTVTSTESSTEIKAMPPETCDVMLLNNARVSFEAVEDVLAEVLQISRTRAMRIAMAADQEGKASVFTGPRDVAEQYQKALTDYSRQQHDEDTDGMGYNLLTFQVEKHEA